MGTKSSLWPSRSSRATANLCSLRAVAVSRRILRASSRLRPLVSSGVRRIAPTGTLASGSASQGTSGSTTLPRPSHFVMATKGIAEAWSGSAYAKTTVGREIKSSADASNPTT